MQSRRGLMPRRQPVMKDNFDSAMSALAHGLTVRRRAWEGERSLVLMYLRGSQMGYVIEVKADGSLHGDDLKIQRYEFSQEDKEAADWECNAFTAEALPRDPRLAN
jgi:hypothetical protein